jgi:hypothetical protein
VSLAAALGAELARRVLPRAPPTDELSELLGGALARLGPLFPAATGSDPVASLASLLIPAGAASERGAVDLAERLAVCLPGERAFAAAGLAAGAAGREAERAWRALQDGASTARGAGVEPRRLLEVATEALEKAGAEGEAVLALWRTLHEASADLVTLAAVGAPKWTGPDVQRLLRQQLAKWIRNVRALGGLPRRSLAVKRQIEAELAFRFSVRLGVAAVLSLGGTVLYGTKELADDLKGIVLGEKSNRDLGNEVHSRLQLAYRARRPFELIEQDDYVYGLGRVSIAAGTRLEVAAREPGRDDLLALYIARQSLKAIDSVLPNSPIKRTSAMVGWSIRDDNTNLTTARVFEIKPVRAAWLGVVQEMYYRSAFNLWVAVLQDLEPVAGAVSKLFDLAPRRGAFAFPCDTLYAGTPADWPEVNSAQGGVLTVAGPWATYTVMVAQFDALPGLVLYWNFELPAAALRLVYDTLRSTLNSMVSTLRRWVIELYTWVVAILIATVAVLAALAAAVAGAAAFEALLAILARLGPLAGPAAAGVKAFREALNAAAPAWTLTATGDALQGRIALGLSPVGAPAAGVERIGVQAGALRVDGLPLDAARHFGAVVQAGFALLEHACPPGGSRGARSAAGRA